MQHYDDYEDYDDENDTSTLSLSPVRTVPSAEDSLGSSDEDDENGENENNTSSKKPSPVLPAGDNQSMSVGSFESSDDLSFTERQRRLWRHGIRHNTSQQHQQQNYEYNYLDENVYVGRGYSLLLPSKKLLALIGAVVLVSVLAIFIPGDGEPSADGMEHPPVAPKFKGAPQYECPEISSSSSSENSKITPGHVFVDYQNGTDFMREIENNYTDFDYHFAEYKDWGITYDEVKESIKHWKVSRFLPNLKTGDSIFESGCGIGLGLLLTLEILQQEGNLRDLHLYGSDFGWTSAAVANGLLNSVLSVRGETGGGKRGVICAADSTKLRFVPDNSFDLVFSGSISPVPDPWAARRNLTSDEILKRRQDICTSKTTDWKSQTLSELAQVQQNDWYGAWVAEMVRIAKPGTPVLVEQIRDPYYCDFGTEWGGGGGVPYQFWRTAIQDYGWDVDPDSIDFEAASDDILFPKQHRYHVFMRKNSKH